MLSIRKMAEELRRSYELMDDQLLVDTGGEMLQATFGSAHPSAHGEDLEKAESLQMPSEGATPGSIKGDDAISRSVAAVEDIEVSQSEAQAGANTKADLDDPPPPEQYAGDDNEKDQNERKVESDQGCFLRRKKMLLVGTATVVLFVALLLLLVIFLKEERVVDMEYMLKLLPEYTLSSLNQTLAPQTEALNWLLEDPRVSNYKDKRLLERFALATIYFSLNGPEWREQELWMNYSHHECEWRPHYAVDRANDALLAEARDDLGFSAAPCVLNPHVSGKYKIGAYQRLQLEGNGLVGNLPPELALLTTLTSLSLDSNAIASKLPTQIGLMTSLKILSLANNKITGSLPIEIQSLGLRSLLMDRNELSGTIPSLVNMTELQFLSLDQNKWRGKVPSAFGSLYNLKMLSLSENALSSTLPVELGGLTSLQRLDLSMNHVSGSLPPQYFQLTSLQDLR